MLHKIVYDVIFNPSKKWSRTGDGMVMIRASQGKTEYLFKDIITD